jgi:hypothetical protein
MAEAAQTLSRHDFEAKIAKRCWEDEAFRKEFTADPSGAFVRYLELPPASVPKIVIHEELAGSWHIVLPEKPANGGELSDVDLETVAGGIPTVVAQVTVPTDTQVVYLSLPAISMRPMAAQGW